MSFQITDKRTIDRAAPVAVEETKKESLVKIYPETLVKAQGEAVRAWVLTVCEK